jgi:hypothetical protein
VLVCLKRDEHVDDTQTKDYQPRFKKVRYNDMPSGTAGCTSRYSACWCSRTARCSAEEKPYRSPAILQEVEDEASSRVANDTPQKRDCRPSPEQTNLKTEVFQRPTLPGLVRASTRMEKLWGSRTVVMCAMSKKHEWMTNGIFISSQGRRADAGNQETRKTSRNKHLEEKLPPS